MLARRLRLAGDFDFDRIARMTPGFVGADLAALTKEAAAIAVTRIFATLEGACGAAAPEQLPAPTTAEEDRVAPAEQLAAAGGAETALVAAALGLPSLSMGAGQPLSAAQLAGLAITAADFEAAVGKVQPSVRREGFATTPDVTWDDVGSLAEACPPSVTCMRKTQRTALPSFRAGMFAGRDTERGWGPSRRCARSSRLQSRSPSGGRSATRRWAWRRPRACCSTARPAAARRWSPRRSPTRAAPTSCPSRRAHVLLCSLVLTALCPAPRVFSHSLHFAVLCISQT